MRREYHREERKPMQLCVACGQVRFKIGVPIWPNHPDGPRVCSTKCAAAMRQEARAAASEEQEEIEWIGRELAAGRDPL